jgi:hypothetical protein
MYFCIVVMKQRRAGVKPRSNSKVAYFLFFFKKKYFKLIKIKLGCKLFYNDLCISQLKTIIYVYIRKQRQP